MTAKLGTTRRRVVTAIVATAASCAYLGWVAAGSAGGAAQACPQASAMYAPADPAADRPGAARLELVLDENGDHVLAPSRRDVAVAGPRLSWLLPRYPVLALTGSGLGQADPGACFVVFEGLRWLPAALEETLGGPGASGS